MTVDTFVPHASVPTVRNLSIPRVFHRVWLGGAPIPAEYEAFARTWLDHHPGWEMVTWTDDTLPPLRNQALFEGATTAAGRADIARYEILHLHGGVYVDTDFECLRNIEELLDGVDAFSATEDGNHISIGIMGAVPGHPVFARAVEELGAHAAARPGRGPNETTGPHFFTAVASGCDELVVFGRELFYPYYMDEPWRRGESFPDAYAVHHWANSWQPAAAESTTPESHQVVAVLDSAAPGAGAVVLATYFDLFAAGEPVELQLVVTGGLEDGNAERLLTIAGELGAGRSGLPEVVPFAPGEPGAPDVPVADGAPHAAACARAVAQLHALRSRLDGATAASTVTVEFPAPAPGLHEGDGAGTAGLRKVFDDIYREGTWTEGIAGIPRSGGGSLPEVSQSVIDWTRAAIRDGPVRSVADIGCGDLTYVKEIAEIVAGDLAYTGYDIVPHLVDEHRQLPWGEFHVADLTAPGFTVAADLVIVKDVLFHLENEQVQQALDNLRASRWKYLITTVNTCTANEPRSFDRFHWAPLDLTLAPFRVRPVERLQRPGGGAFIVVTPDGLR